MNHPVGQNEVAVRPSPRMEYTPRDIPSDARWGLGQLRDFIVLDEKPLLLQMQGRIRSANITNADGTPRSSPILLVEPDDREDFHALIRLLTRFHNDPCVPFPIPALVCFVREQHINIHSTSIKVSNVPCA